MSTPQRIYHVQDYNESSMSGFMDRHHHMAEKYCKAHGITPTAPSNQDKPRLSWDEWVEEQQRQIAAAVVKPATRQVEVSKLDRNDDEAVIRYLVSRIRETVEERAAKGTKIMTYVLRGQAGLRRVDDIPTYTIRYKDVKGTWRRIECVAGRVGYERAAKTLRKAAEMASTSDITISFLDEHEHPRLSRRAPISNSSQKGEENTRQEVRIDRTPGPATN